MPQFPLDTFRRRLVAAVLSGALISIAESLHPWWPAAWLAPVPLLAAAFVAPRYEASWLAIVAGLIGCTSTGLYYVTVASPIVAILIAAGRALSLAVLINIARMLVARWRHWLSIFAYPTLTAGLDTLIGAFSRHGSAGSLAYSQMNALPILQVASLAGTSGIVFVINLFASAVAVAWYHRGQQKHYRIGYILAAGIVVLAVGFGSARLISAPSEPEVKVGLIVVDTAPGAKAPSPEVPPWTYYWSAIAQAAREGARIVVLPEKIAAFTSEQIAPIRDALARAAESNKVFLVAGVTVVLTDHKENRAWMFDPSGAMVADYSKRHLVPGFEDAFVAGGNEMVRIIDGNLTGIAICKDMDFPRLGRDYAEQDVTMMLVPAWDFGGDAWLHSRMAVLRGVEGGYTIVRAAREGVLTISDRYGRVLDEVASSGTPYSSLVAMAPLATERETVYGVLGNTFGWLALAFGIAISIRAAVTVNLWNWLRAGSR